MPKLLWLLLPASSLVDAFLGSGRGAVASMMKKTASLDDTASDLFFPTIPQPHPDISEEDLVPMLLDCLKNNDKPFIDAGLRTTFAFCTNMITKALSSEEEFVRNSHASVFGATLNCVDYEMEELNVVPSRGTTPARASQTCSVVSVDGRRRRFLWLLVQERRPPLQGCWLVDGCIGSDVDGKIAG